MGSYRDPSRQTQEVIFSGRCNNDNFSSCKSQKPLGVLVDSKLTLEKHYQEY